MTKHKPVLLKEVLEVLNPGPGEIAVDCTLGGGGHAEEILKKVSEEGFLLGIDADPNAVNNFNLKNAKNAKAVQGNFKNIKEITSDVGLRTINVILFDLGFSSDQLDDSGRGFSFQASGPLDMRLNPSQGITAAEILNRADEKELIEIIKNYGEEKNARRIAKAVVATRRIEPIKTTDEFFALIKKVLPAAVRFKAGDVARRTFQAFRIAVNNELEAIEKGLKEAFAVLSPGGRMAAISFHSLEDRIVKNYFNELAKGCICPPEFPVCICGHEAEALILTRKPITPTEEELKQNPRSASAKLRAIKKNEKSQKNKE